jgi:(E)-4-hydroxy-3-methylbut-2-enyl-diphosphate synthase
VQALVRYAEEIMADGADAVLARADSDGARRAAEADRASLLADQGTDANDSASRVELIRKHLDQA